MTRRTLTLKREVLAELTPDALRAVVGAADDLSGPSCPRLLCDGISDLFVVTTCCGQTSPC